MPWPGLVNEEKSFEIGVARDGAEAFERAEVTGQTRKVLLELLAETRYRPHGLNSSESNEQFRSEADQAVAHARAYLMLTRILSSAAV